MDGAETANTTGCTLPLHLYIYPWLHDWSDGSPIRQHIDHIKGRGDLWYVGFGHLYLYRYVQERGQVTVSALAGM